MLKFLYKHRILLLCLSIPYFFIILFAFVKVDYDITTPAHISEVENIISIEDGSKLTGTINVTSVYSYEKVSVLSYLIAHTNKYAEINELADYSNFSYSDLMIGGTIQKNNSVYNSIIAGYKAAGYTLDYEFDGYYVTNTFQFTSDFIGVGDKIISVNGVNLTEEVDFYSTSSKFAPNDLELGVIKYQTDNEIKIRIEIGSFIEDGETYYSYGINVEPTYKPLITENCPEFTIAWNKINSIGGSGGLLQAFYVYESLTGGNLSKGLKIAGTGTIDKDGNVGLIGGIKQKIITAEFSDVDIFIVPVTSENYINNPDEVNYIDAMEGYLLLDNPNITLIPAWSLESLIDALLNYHGGSN